MDTTDTRSKKSPTSYQEPGRLGGQARKQQRGPEFCAELGRKGGVARAAREQVLRTAGRTGSGGATTLLAPRLLLRRSPPDRPRFSVGQAHGRPRPCPAGENMRHAFLTGALAVLLLTPLASAQAAGTQLRGGDADFVPVAKAASIPLSVNENDFGTPLQVTDNCLLIDTGKQAGPGARTKDLRLTPCMGFDAGTAVDDTKPQAAAELGAPYPVVPGVTVQYADANNNGKYDKGDWVYVTTSAVAGIVPSTATGAWTVRVTPAGGHPAFTFVLAGDSDLVSHGSGTKLLAANVAERSDGSWFLVLAAPGTPTPVVPRGALIPENSVRLTPGGMPEVEATGISFAPAQPVAGQPVQLSVEVRNAGKTAGSGFLATSLDGSVVDTRATPWLGPGGKATVVVALTPPAAGRVNVSVGALNIVLPVAAAPPPQPDAQVAALAQRVAALETQLADADARLAQDGARLERLEAALHGPPSAGAGNATHAAAVSGGSAATGVRSTPALPFPGALVALLGAAALAVRRP